MVSGWVGDMGWHEWSVRHRPGEQYVAEVQNTEEVAWTRLSHPID
jgi:hypothetical protein